jgi:endonuclease/exonuclease/phosphatase family metal-dependent hydrolase
MTYNLWNGGIYLGKHTESPAPELVKSIDSIHADVLLLCELNHTDNPLLMDSLLKRYPYNSYVLTDSDNMNEVQVLSRFPIQEVRRVAYTDSLGQKSDALIWLMKIVTPQGNVNLAACHLASNQYGSIRDSMKATASWWSGRHQYLKYLRLGYDERKREAVALRDSLDRMTGPIIAMGDFNDIGGSYTVRRTMGDDLNDAWWSGGLGYGFTYDMYHLLLRLDHILYSDDKLELQGVKVLSDWKYSDHYPLVADFKYNMN